MPTRIVSSAGSISSGEVAEFYPDKPKEGENLNIVYHAGKQGSKFSPRDSVYAVYQILFQDGGLRIEGAKMDRQGDDFVVSTRIVPGVAVVNSSFVTLSPGSYDYDYPGLRVMVHNQEGAPVLNACCGAMHSKNYDELFRKERSLYPENYGAYYYKWQNAALDLGEGALSIINADMLNLEKVDREDSGLWLSLAYGYLQQNKEAMCRDVLLRMLAKYPGNEDLLGIISSYYAYAATCHLPVNIVRKVDEAIEQAIDRRPTSSCWRWLLLKERLRCSMDRTQGVCEQWIAEDRDNPFPYAILGSRFNDENVHLKRAASLIDQAIELALSGKLRLHFDIHGALGDIYLGKYYKTLAEIMLKLKDYGRAYAGVQAARALTCSDPQVAFTEGDIWLKLGNLKAARRSFLEAWQWGHEEAKSRMRAIWERSERRLDDFESWFDGLVKLESGKSPAKLAVPMSDKAAPPFSGKDVNGNKVSSAEWQGKVVVMNFWFTACTPCRAEIPELNRLVVEFKDVVFVAVGIDDIETLRAFLKKVHFSYVIVSDRRQEIAQKFAINIYPTHVVIDQKGNICFRRNGGGSRIYDELASVIRRLYE